jgi:uncharacterized protein YqhQ
MRTPDRWAVAVRAPDGSIYSEAHPVRSVAASHPFARRALVRGPVALVEAMTVALDAIRVAIRVATGADPDRRQVATTLGAAGFTFLVLFVAGPGVAVGAAHVGGVGGAAAEAAVRLAMFAVYLLLVSRSRGASQLFAYHGAEHKVIAAFERAGVLPSREQARAASPVHDRCGTNFATLIVLCAGVVYAVVPRAPLWAGALWRALLFPVVGAVAYEIMRLAAREHTQLWARVVTWPGRAAQRITTREPHDAQLEVAHAALERLLAD